MRGLNKLEKMKGQIFMYMTRREKILYHVKDDEREQVIIVTDQRPHKVSYEKLDKYLIDFIGPIDEAPEPTLPAVTGNGLPSRVVQTFVVDSQTITTLKDTLLENITKVKESKDYIPQAFEINQQVKTLLSLAKTEIDLAKINKPTV